MDKDEEILFDDLDKEMVSLPVDDEVLEYIEEQPVEDVPSNSNGGKLAHTAKEVYNYQKDKKNNKNDNKKKNANPQNNNVNNIKSSTDFQKNNKATIDRLNDVKNKGQGLNKGNLAAQAGKEIGNKIAGKSEEEKGKLEKATDDIGGKAASTAITAATGGAVSGPAAEALGNAAYQILKKQLERKIKMYAIIIGAIVFSVLIFIIVFASSEGDEQKTSTGEINSFVAGTMTDEELEKYLIYIGVCTRKGENYELSDEDENKINTADCKYAKQYFRKIKSNYEKIKEECTLALNQPKDINNPCGVELNVPLLHETLSYGKSNDELWNKRASGKKNEDGSYTNVQEKDIDDLSNAMVEYVFESCYQWVSWYRTRNGSRVDYNCEGCTFIEKTKEPREWFYFQLSFDKYISFLKYGQTSSHPYYSSGYYEPKIENLRLYSVWKSFDTNYVKFGENHDHECVGQTDSKFDFDSSSLLTSSGNSSIRVVCEQWSGNQSMCDTTKCNWNESTKACTNKTSSNINGVVCEQWSGNQSMCDTTKCNWNNTTRACTNKTSSNINSVVCEQWSGNQSMCDTTKCNWNNTTRACTNK